MDKSQLRRLALDYAHGQLSRDQYRESRAALLDDLVSGRVRIERETAVVDIDVTQPSAFVPAQPQMPDLQAEPAPRVVLSPLHMGIGAGLLVLLAVAGVWLFTAGDAPPPPVVVTPPPAPAVSPARSLVERFVAEKDFSERSLSAFQTGWAGLDAADIDEARGAPWFRRLVTIVVQEVKTQKALADLDGTGTAVEKARRLVDFGRFLGISEGMLPEVSAAAAPPSPTATAPPAQSPSIETPATVTVMPEPSPPARTPAAPQVATALPAPSATDMPVTSPAVALPPPTPARPNGREWLQAQAAGSYTLQLFALNHLEKVESLIARHPELDLHLIDYSPAEPRYRVLYGNYATVDQARAAHAGLPEDVRRAQPEAFARVIGEILADAPPGPAPAVTRAPAMTASPSSDWLRQQPAGRYTLQLFASNSHDNAQRVVRRFPDLALALHESTDDRSRYRVLYGSFSSAEEARRAFNSLPAGLAADAGLPLVKSIGELQVSEVRPVVN